MQAWYSINKTLTFIKKIFFYSNDVFGCNALKYLSMSNQECKPRPVIININSNEHSLYPYIINAAVVIIIYNVSYAKLYVPDVLKNINNNAFNLMQNINETRHVF